MNSRGQRIVIAAAQAAIDEARATPSPPPRSKKRRLSAGRAVLLGAGLVTAGRIATGSRPRQLLGGLAERIEDLESRFAPDGGSE